MNEFAAVIVFDFFFLQCLNDSSQSLHLLINSKLMRFC